MSLAADTRDAVRDRPFLRTALRAGVVNYSAAAAWLVDDAGLDGDPEAVATALRRFADDLPAYATDERRASVAMRSGVGLAPADDTPDSEDALLTVTNSAITSDGTDTAIVATGNVDPTALSAVLDRLATNEVAVAAAGVAGDALVVVVGRRDGATAVRVVEDALERVPERDGL